MYRSIWQSDQYGNYNGPLRIIPNHPWKTAAVTTIGVPLIIPLINAITGRGIRPGMQN
jgi:hypothetical protein